MFYDFAILVSQSRLIFFKVYSVKKNAMFIFQIKGFNQIRLDIGYSYTHKWCIMCL